MAVVVAKCRIMPIFVALKAGNNMAKRVFEDKDFGKIIVGSRSNARNLSLSVRADGLHVTVPPYTKFSTIIEAVEKYRSQLLPSFERVRPQGITPGFRISAECFRLSLQQGKGKNFTLHYGEDEVTLFYPPETDFGSKTVQTTIRNGIVRALKHNAALMLPPVLEMFAQRHRLTYKKVKINGARRRWGSCTAAGTINLSCYLMLLPPHLSDYVLLHELAHTVEMNHGPRFWRLLDSFTDNKAQTLRKELRNYRLLF